MADTEPKSIKVLSIDGGGIRGIIPAVILGEIRQRLEGDLYKFFDLIAGTSTGGIIALGLGTQCNAGKPYSPDDLLKLYVQNGAAIFRTNWFTWLRKCFRPKYSPRALEATLAQYFGDTQLESALTPLLISSYDLNSQKPFFFKSHVIARHPDWNWPVVKVARATSAAPTYFPPLSLTNGNEEYDLADGGVHVNNPAMAAYAEARRIYPQSSRFFVVAVGTGDRQDHIPYRKARKWGLLQWATQIVPIFMDSVSEAADYELTSILRDDYHRLQIEDLGSAEADMDNVTAENLTNLQKSAEKYVKDKDIAKMLDGICAELKQGRGSDMPGKGRK